MLYNFFICNEMEADVESPLAIKFAIRYENDIAPPLLLLFVVNVFLFVNAPLLVTAPLVVDFPFLGESISFACKGSSGLTKFGLRAAPLNIFWASSSLTSLGRFSGSSFTRLNRGLSSLKDAQLTGLDIFWSL